MSRTLGGFLLRCLVGALLLSAWEGSTDARASVAAAEPGAKVSVYFDLSGSSPAGVASPGQPLHLSIRLTGVRPPDDRPVVAIIEGQSFVRRLVPMRYDAQDRAFHSTVELEPVTPELAAGRAKALRVRATFARMHEMELEEFLVRAVYLTIGVVPETHALNTTSRSSAPQALSEGFAEAQGQAPAELNDRSEGAFTERNIIPSPVPARAQRYWRGVSERLGQRWRRPAGSASNQTPSGPAVAVRFRLHANGEAQLIQIERSSGVPAIDEAGLQAVLRAHPFPPFPADVTEESVDLHVEFGPAPARSRSARERHGAPDAH